MLSKKGLRSRTNGDSCLGGGRSAVFLERIGNALAQTKKLAEAGHLTDIGIKFWLRGHATILGNYVLRYFLRVAPLHNATIGFSAFLRHSRTARRLHVCAVPGPRAWLQCRSRQDARRPRAHGQRLVPRRVRGPSP